MTSEEFQGMVGDEYHRRGYQVEALAEVREWGVDLLVSRGSERTAVKIQVDASAAVDRAMVLELEGARRYLDCTGAAIATAGQVLAEAAAVAQKLGISIERLDFSEPSREPAFEQLWSEWIMPLQGEVLDSGRGGNVQVVKVDGSGVERISSKGQSGFIPIDIFRTVVHRLWEVGVITRDEINTLCLGLAPSGVALILSQVPEFDYGGHPAALRLKGPSSVSLTARQQTQPEDPFGGDSDSLEALKDQGFMGFHTLGELWADGSSIPKEKGVYVVVYTGTKEPGFLLHGSGGHSKGDPNVPLRTLRSNWVKGASIVYIGKAGGGDTKATLHSRLKQYLDFGRGKPAKHHGGRYIWQLKEPGQLLVAWKTLAQEDPAQLESELIRQFVKSHGQLPFANLLD